MLSEIKKNNTYILQLIEIVLIFQSVIIQFNCKIHFKKIIFQFLI